MNKGLREQIEKRMPAKTKKLCQDAQETAEKDFATCCESIEEGKFIPVENNVVRVFADNARTSEENKLWRDAYDEKLAALFAEESLEVVKISRSISCECASVYLKL